MPKKASKSSSGKTDKVFNSEAKKKMPKVLPVQDPDEVDNFGANIHSHLPAIGGFGGGSLTLIIGAVKTGKSTLLSNLFLNDNFFESSKSEFLKFFGKITADATTGPDKDPLPASSQPISILELNRFKLII